MESACVDHTIVDHLSKTLGLLHIPYPHHTIQRGGDYVVVAQWPIEIWIVDWLALFNIKRKVLPVTPLLCPLRVTMTEGLWNAEHTVIFPSIEANANKSLSSCANSMHCNQKKVSDEERCKRERNGKRLSVKDVGWGLRVMGERSCLKNEVRSEGWRVGRGLFLVGDKGKSWEVRRSAWWEGMLLTQWTVRDRREARVKMLWESEQVVAYRDSSCVFCEYMMHAGEFVLARNALLHRLLSGRRFCISFFFLFFSLFFLSSLSLFSISIFI